MVSPSPFRSLTRLLILNCVENENINMTTTLHETTYKLKVHACCCNWRHECYCTLQLRPHFTNISSHVSHLKTVTSCSWHVNIYLFVFFLGACVWRRHTGVWFPGRSNSTSCTHTTVLPGCECLTPFPCQTPWWIDYLKIGPVQRNEDLTPSRMNSPIKKIASWFLNSKPKSSLISLI